MNKFYVRPGDDDSNPVDLWRNASVWALTDADILALDAVIRPIASRLRLGLARDHVVVGKVGIYGCRYCGRLADEPHAFECNPNDGPLNH